MTAPTVWFRNPDNYIKELVEAGQHNVIWDRGYLFKKRLDPIMHAKLYFPGVPFRLIDMGNEDQGAAEYQAGCERNQPVAVYPVVSMMNDRAISQLEELAGNPSGENEDVCKDLNVPADERPVFGQPHMSMVTDFPSMSTGRGRSLIRTIRDVQSDFPDCVIHIHGLYSWHTLWGMGFGSVDYEPRSMAQQGKIILPPGKEVKFEAGMLLPQWISLLNFKPKDLAIPRNRCIYNIKSAVWASEHWSENLNRRFKRDPGNTPVDTDSSDRAFVPATTRAPYSGTLPILPTDRIHCDSCSLTAVCKQYREGSVCTLDSDNKGLATMFKTRDSGVVIEGLSAILQKQAQRAERAMDDEEEFQELSPEVTSMLNALFSNGIKYAKLIDPALRAGPKVNVNVAGGAVSVGSERATPQQIMRDVIAALEEQGFSRNEITPVMIRGMMESMYGRVDSTVPAIEGEVALESQ